MHLRKKINAELSNLIHQLEEEAREENKASSRVLIYSAIGKIVEAGRLIHDSFSEDRGTEKERRELLEYRGRLKKDDE